MDDHLVHITPIHHPPKMDVLPKDFSSVVQHSNVSAATTFAFSSVCFFLTVWMVWNGLEMVIPLAVTLGAPRGRDQPGDIQRPLPAPFGNIKSVFNSQMVVFVLVFLP